MYKAKQTFILAFKIKIHFKTVACYYIYKDSNQRLITELLAEMEMF